MALVHGTPVAMRTHLRSPEDAYSEFPAIDVRSRRMILLPPKAEEISDAGDLANIHVKLKKKKTTDYVG